MLETLASKLVRALSSAQVVVVGLHVHRARLLDLLLLAFAEDDAKRFHDRLRDIVLNSEDILHLPIVPLRPELISISNVDELRGDAKAIAHAPHTSIENGRYLELLSYLGEILVFALQRKRHGS